jgi:hypothetical protein
MRAIRAFALLVLWCVAVPALAQPSDADRDRARELFQRGARFARQNRWRDAVAAFEESVGVFDHASTRYNLGYSERALGRGTRAYVQFSRALALDERSGGKELGATERAAAADYRAEILGALGRIDLRVVPATARVSVDGAPLEEVGDGTLVAGTRARAPAEPIGGEARILVEPGDHVVEVSTPDDARSVEARVEAGTTRELEVVLEGRRADGDAPPLEPSKTRWYAGWAVGGAGAASLVVAVALTASAAVKWDQAQEACPLIDVCPDATGAELSNTARREAGFATVAYAIAVAGGIGAAVLWIAAPTASDSGAATARVRIAPGALVVDGVF